MSKTQIIITIDDSNLSEATKIDYNYRVGYFFKNSKIKSFEKLIDISTDELQYELIKYTQFLVNRVKIKEISPNSVSKYYKGIKYFLDVNYRENDVKWKPIKALFPNKVRLSGYKSWTTEQILEMEKYCKSARNMAFLHFQASTGSRMGVHDSPLLMKHLVPMSSENNETNSKDCYAVLVYAEYDESADEKDTRESEVDDVQSGDSYWAFLTPEATKHLRKYHDQRKRDGEIFSDEIPIFRIEFKINDSNKNIKQLSHSSAIAIMNRMIANTSLRRAKKGKRYDIQLAHGLRKRFNTIMKLENTVNSNIAEKLMGHKNGLDGVYFTPTREQCFREFVKAIPELTVDPTERQKIEIAKKDKNITELQEEEKKGIKKDEEILKYKAVIEVVTEKLLGLGTTDNKIAMNEVLQSIGLEKLKK